MDCKFKSYLFSNKSVKDSIIEGNKVYSNFCVLFMNFIGVIFSLIYLNRLRSKFLSFYKIKNS